MDSPDVENMVANSSKFGKSTYVDPEGYPISSIVKNSDSEEPLESCQMLVLDLVHQQMLMLISKAEDVAKARRSGSIGYLEMLFGFRRHPSFIRRLLQYMRLNDSMASLAFSLSDSAPGYTLAADKRDDKVLRSNALLNALREMDVADAFSSLFDSTAPDETKIERVRRMTARIQKMDTAAYEKFASARTTSFCSRKGKKSQTYSKRFLEWLGSPCVEDGIVYILNYCAIEILAVVTDSALLCREQEGENLFPDEHPRLSLQLRHYEAALRRNLGYSKRGDILFGNF